MHREVDEGNHKIDAKKAQNKVSPVDLGILFTAPPDYPISLSRAEPFAWGVWGVVSQCTPRTFGELAPFSKKGPASTSSCAANERKSCSHHGRSPIAIPLMLLPGPSALVA